MKKNYLQIIGCGASQGVPTPDGDWGNCKKNKKILELEVPFI